MFGVPTVLLGIVGLIYALLIPILALQVLSLLFIPSMILHGAKPKQVGRAIYCYLLQMVGVFFLTLGAVPALYGVLAKQNFDSKIYLSLLILFAAGGLTFLWHDNLLHTVDDVSRAVPEAIYRYTFKFLGYSSALVSAIVLLLRMLLTPTPLTETWWVMPSIFLCHGILLSWCTRDEMKHAFQAHKMQAPPSRPEHPVKKRKKKVTVRK